MKSVAKKSFGQHFLKDKNVLERIAGLVDMDVVVEIGPGQGALTEYLKGELTLVEADRDLIPHLKERFTSATLIEGDAVKVDFDKISNGRDWMLVGNLPYNASAAIMENAMSSKNPPKSMVVMVQKEQADRMRAKPGNMGLLSVVVQLGYSVKKAFNVSPEAFSPKPRVDSTVLVLKRLDPPRYEGGRVERERIIKLAKAGFSARRKQLKNNLVNTGFGNGDEIKSHIESLGHFSNVRAQALSVSQWSQLSRKLLS